MATNETTWRGYSVEFEIRMETKAREIGSESLFTKQVYVSPPYFMESSWERYHKSFVLHHFTSIPTISSVQINSNKSTKRLHGRPYVRLIHCSLSGFPAQSATLSHNHVDDLRLDVEIFVSPINLKDSKPCWAASNGISHGLKSSRTWISDFVVDHVSVCQL